MPSTPLRARMPLRPVLLGALPSAAMPLVATSAPAKAVRVARPALGGAAVLAIAGVLAATAGNGTQAATASTGTIDLPESSTAAFTLASYTVPAIHAPQVATKAHRAAAHVTATTVTPVDHEAAHKYAEGLRRLRTCESGGNYHEATGNGYYGAYQFTLSTWHSLGLSGMPNYASRELQDAAVTRLAARKGWGQWPVCSYVAGLR